MLSLGSFLFPEEDAAPEVVDSLPAGQEDPDQVPMSDSTTPTTLFRPVAPKMGGLAQVSSNDWCAWTGGKPKPDWSGLDDKAPTDPLEEYQYRPSNPGSSVKAKAFREKGLTTKFTKSDNLLDFIQTVELYLQRMGMDTISYLPDPDDNTKVLSVVTCSTRFSLEAALESARDFRKTKYDRYDRNNDDSAKHWLLDSLDPELAKDIKDRLFPTDGFVCH